MKAVILAAGMGRRMGKSQPKPLVLLYGLPLIEHKIRKLKGFEIIVVYHDRRIKDYLNKKFPYVKTVYNPDPERENGFSLLCAKNFFKKGEKFVLLMADHFYDKGFYENIKEFPTTTLFVSKRCFQEDEATKVKVSGEKIIKIGKQLTDYDYFDTGFFVCDYAVFNYAEKLAKTSKKVYLSGVMQEVANDGKLGYFVIDKFWIDIDTENELKIAEKYIRSSLVKKTDGFISRYINRKISTRITPFLLGYDFITPNLLTVIISMLGVSAGVLMFFKQFLIGGLITQLVSILDGIDGEIARIKNISTRFGSVLDSVLDRYIDITVLSGIYLSGIKSFYADIFFIMSVTGSILVSYVSHLTGKRPFFATRDIRLFIIMVICLFSYFGICEPFLIFPAIGIMTHTGVLYMIYKTKRG